MDTQAIETAFAAYIRDGNPVTAMALARAYRTAGLAGEAIALLRQWGPKAVTLYERVQIGIDMNYLGMFEEAEALLAGAEGEPMSAGDHYIRLTELATARYGLGKFHAAHDLFRETRDGANKDVFLAALYRQSPEAVISQIRDKFLTPDEPVAGKRVLILTEGGAGDLIMYSRYAGALKAEGAKSVHFLTPPALLDLFRQDREAEVEFTTDCSALIYECDWITWTFHLFARYQHSPYFPHLPARAYLAPPTPRDLEGGRGGRKIGLIWRSESGVRHEPYRSMSLETLAPLLENTRDQFYSLQYGALSEAERALLEHHGVIDLGPHIQTFADTGAMLQSLDLLISIDTGAAHLAGALGRPVWLMLAQACDWRWYDDQRFTPWYESMRLYRQTVLGDWSGVVGEMAASDW